MFDYVPPCSYFICNMFQSGKIVEGLDFHEGVRDKLNEIKRREIERLREEMSKLIEKERYEDIKIPDHLDHGDSENFSKDDLKKLIKKVYTLCIM